jgi:hypothetical protein
LSSIEISCWSNGGNILALQPDARVSNVAFSRDALSVDLLDGRTISVPLAWYPKLLHATQEQLNNWKIAGGGYGIYWPDLDEDLSTEGLLRGAPAPRHSAKV